MYAIVDIETTGGHAAHHRITELAILIHDGKKITDRFETLIDPGMSVPPMITQLTGIDDKMLEGAPTFASIADVAMEMLQDKIFVAHNVNFDHSFMKREFAEVGMKFLPKKLCTVRMSRKLIPEASGYGLGRLCGSLGINIKGRHRAGGDAEATAELLTILLKRDKEGVIDKAINRRSREATLPANLPKSHFDALPECVGIYQFLDRSGRHLYVGKANNIKKRVMQHFTGSGETHRDQVLKREVRQVEFLETGSELIALLEESHLIRKFWPTLNKAHKFPKANYGIVSYTDRSGKTRMAVKKLLKVDRPVLRGRSILELREVLYRVAREEKLCHLLIGLQTGQTICVRADEEGEKCYCNGFVKLSTHNSRMVKALTNIGGKEDLMMLGQGRNDKENSLVLIEQGTYIGYAYVPKGFDHSIPNDALIARKQSDDTHRIIAQAMRNSKYEVLKSIRMQP